MIQQELVSEESGDSSVHGQTSWIACGLKIQEMQFTEDASTLPLGDYSEFDHVDSVDGSGASHSTGPLSPTHCHTPCTSNSSGINNVNAEDISILLPSTLGWEWSNNITLSFLGSEALVQLLIKMEHGWMNSGQLTGFIGFVPRLSFRVDGGAGKPSQ
ncbi:hypothetical protein BJY52DRAFT_1227258 [Lactarius psammicola]|nr:hypothetical protein BJY52DRAFT_1227258 [Lactarius psammicola]